VLEEHPAVLEDPAPVVTFEGFGDSALNFLIFAFLPSLDRRLPVTHDLNSAIHRELARAGIEIPFPQRDLHLRSVPDGLFNPSNEHHHAGNGSGRSAEPTP
jgi:potassium efflux system protein